MKSQMGRGRSNSNDVHVSELQVNLLDCREAHQSLGFHVALFTEVVCQPKTVL